MDEGEHDPGLIDQEAADQVSFPDKPSNRYASTVWRRFALGAGKAQTQSGVFADTNGDGEPISEPDL